MTTKLIAPNETRASSVRRIVVKGFRSDLPGFFFVAISWGTAANEPIGFPFSHAEEVGQKVETGRNCHRVQLGRHVPHVTRDVERLLWRDVVSVRIPGVSPTTGVLSSEPILGHATNVRVHLARAPP